MYDVFFNNPSNCFILPRSVRLLSWWCPGKSLKNTKLPSFHALHWKRTIVRGFLSCFENNLTSIYRARVTTTWTRHESMYTRAQQFYLSRLKTCVYSEPYFRTPLLRSPISNLLEMLVMNVISLI